ncbi:carbohydate-binding domain-containing protein, partial [Cellvibrio sp.]
MFAQNAELRFGTVSNFGREGAFTAQVTINNNSSLALPKGEGNWTIYIHSLKRILSSDSPQFTFNHLQAD